MPEFVQIYISNRTVISGGATGIVVDHIQATDISKLEIWVTRDRGQTWKLNSIDQDRQSPVAIEVDDDGVFGYRICIQTVDGLESAQPARGDSADVWVEVDTTKPSVELISVPYGLCLP